MKQDDKQQGQERKPYEKPGIKSEQVYETMALACSKQDASSCPFGNQQS